jgi:hypothetical protein
LLEVAGLAHKYHCTDLANICVDLARGRALRDAKLVGPGPTVPDLLLLAQRTSNPAILADVLKRGFASYAPTTPPLTPNPARYAYSVTCPVHIGEALPCYWGCAPGLGAAAAATANAAAAAAAALAAAPVFDDAARAQLALLNGSTLVRLLENVLRPPPAIAKK